MTTPQLGYSSHFGLDNIPFGIASSNAHPKPSCVSRYEDNVIFLTELVGIFDGIEGFDCNVFHQSAVNEFAASPEAVQQAVREQLQQAIKQGVPKLPNGSLENITDVVMHMPVQVGDFTDFSCSHHHVQNASEAMMGVRSTPPAFFHMPIGYAGRCSSLQVSGTPIVRPMGMYREDKNPDSQVIFGASQKMDFELELGCIVGKPVPRNARVSASTAGEHIFGYVLVNDWSARDIQGLEMNPLGPLNGKNLGTTISPWVVTLEAMKPYRTKPPPRQLKTAAIFDDSGTDGLSIALRAEISGVAGTRTHCRSNASSMYWSLEQCLTHQATAGCGLRTGDLLASGTVSGPGDEEHGCLMEHMRAGEQPPRGYLEDRETVTLSGLCGDGVGFGECVGELVPAQD